MLQFCAPHEMKFHRSAGFEGDIHDRIELSLRGETGTLVILTVGPSWGPFPESPDWDRPPFRTTGEFYVSRWQCAEIAGTDYRLVQNGRRWRMRSLPEGFAEYRNVSVGIAAEFDRVIDSMCCQPLQEPKHKTGNAARSRTLVR
jgi:hypothetical protein